MNAPINDSFCDAIQYISDGVIEATYVDWHDNLFENLAQGMSSKHGINQTFQAFECNEANNARFLLCLHCSFLSTGNQWTFKHWACGLLLMSSWTLLRHRQCKGQANRTTELRATTYNISSMWPIKFYEESNHFIFDPNYKGYDKGLWHRIDIFIKVYLIKILIVLIWYLVLCCTNLFKFG